MPSRERRVIKLLSRVLYEVVKHKVSIDVAFKRACKRVCAEGLEERERLYEMARSVVSNYILIQCLTGKVKSFGKAVRSWIKGLENLESLPPWCRLSYSKWFYDELKALLGSERVEAVLRAMNERRWWLRINTLKASEERVLRMLEAEGVRFEVDKDFSYMVRVISTPRPVRLLKPVKEYLAIPQDKASAAVVEALRPEADDLIIDMASAPGIKASLIMMLTENRARLLCLDISYRRLVKEVLLLKRLGVNLSRVWIAATDSRKPPLNWKGCKVLLDAPCSNSGAVDKDPGIKIHLTKSKVNYYSSIQRSLLKSALSIGNLIVYSTCSILPEEGELVVNDFKEAVRFERVFKWMSPGYPVVSFSESVMRTYPDIHGTEAFFLAVMYLSG